MTVHELCKALQSLVAADEIKGDDEVVINVDEGHGPIRSCVLQLREGTDDDELLYDKRAHPFEYLKVDRIVTLCDYPYDSL